MKKLSAGTYFIGDPSYVMADEEWSEIWKPPVNDLHSYEHWYSAKAGPGYWTHSTKKGDGIYNGKSNTKETLTVGVDSGCVGVVKMDGKKLTNDKKLKLKRLGHFMRFHRPFYCQYQTGVFFIGQTAKKRVAENVVHTDEDGDTKSVETSAPVIIFT